MGFCKDLLFCVSFVLFLRTCLRLFFFSKTFLWNRSCYILYLYLLSFVFFIARQYTRVQLYSFMRRTYPFFTRCKTTPCKRVCCIIVFSKTCCFCCCLLFYFRNLFEIVHFLFTIYYIESLFLPFVFISFETIDMLFSFMRLLDICVLHREFFFIVMRLIS